MSTRTDIHAPKHFDPQHYSFIGLIYIGPLDDAWSDPSDPEARDFINEHKHVGVYGLGQCDHCGARHTYCWIWHYEGPGTHGWISVGGDCAHGRFQCPDRATFELATMRRKVANMREYGKKSAAVREILDANPELAEAIEWVKEARAHLDDLAATKLDIANRGDEDTSEYADACREHATASRLIGWNINTIEDIASKLFRFGGITPKQVQFVTALAKEGARKQADAKRVAEEVAAMEPLTAGRQEITGTIKSAKHVEGYGGDDVLKIAVTLDSGHTIYGTCPQALVDALDACAYDIDHNGGILHIADYRGARISMKATIDPSVGDNDFAVYKRPASVTLHNASEVTQRLRDHEIAKIEERVQRAADALARATADAKPTEEMLAENGASPEKIEGWRSRYLAPYQENIYYARKVLDEAKGESTKV